MLLCLLGRNFNNTRYRVVTMIKPYTKYYKYLKGTAVLAVILGEHILI